jgi:prepilin-type N-terminal cleavage/methylation domain-containing protein
MSKGFTLIELLIVIGVIAVLAVVVVLVLNPLELLKQSRDSSRVSDLATISSALGIFVTDTSGNGSLGQASTTYVSIADPSATSTAGDHCEGLHLPTSTYAYHCASPSAFKNVDGTGWIPVNFSSISSGPPFGSLPTDPISLAASNFYYTYTTDGGTKYELNSIMESGKQRTIALLNPPVRNLPGAIAQGSSFDLSNLFNTSGLVGYWPMEEGNGITMRDLSGSGMNGTLGGAGVWVSGKIGAFAINLQSSENMIFNPTSSLPTNSLTASAWVNISSNNDFQVFNESWASVAGAWTLYGNNSGGPTIKFGVVDNSVVAHQVTCATTLNTWHFIAGTYDGSNVSAYLDGVICGQTALSSQTLYAGLRPSAFAQNPGSMDDVRLYNRALSSAEIEALYNAQK